MQDIPTVAVLPLLIPIIAIIGGLVLAGLAIHGQIRRREFEHRERLAMIEKGITPSVTTPPEPRGTTLSPFGQADSYEDRAVRLRRGGFILMAIACGIGFLIWATDHNPGDAIGIGGFLLILGAAIYVSAYFGRPPGATKPSAGDNH